jgi:hypothetical protein
MVHTNFASKRKEALKTYELMRDGLEDILRLIPLEVDATDENMDNVLQAIGEFIDRF